ncbi:MAG: zinc-dependent alcohol dehydrogenase family protein [Cyanobacteria bacterium P01_F01_bin.150]
MKNIIFSRFGNPKEVLTVHEIASDPLPKGMARVDVLRTPVNPSDVVTIEGRYGDLPELPATPGLEGLGRVREVNGTGIDIGSLVLLPGGGAWATEVLCNVEALVPLPEADLDQLSMLTVNPATAYLLLRDYVDLKPGDWIIQSAANSAVGQYVMQLGKARGIKVVCVVRREEAKAELLDNGADAAFVDGPDLAARVQTELGTKMRLALDAVSGETFGHLAETLEYGGTLVSFGGLSGRPAQIDDGLIIFNNVQIKGFWLLPWIQNSSSEELAKVYSALTQDVIAGRLHADVAACYSLEQFADAMQAYETPGRNGKILFAPNGV